MTGDIEKLIYYRHNVTGKAVRIHSGRINFCELTVVLSGKLEYKIDGETIMLEAGDALCLPFHAERCRAPSGNSVDYASFNYLIQDSPSLPVHCRSVVGGEARMLIKVCDEIKKQAYEQPFPLIFSVMQSILMLIKTRLDTQKQSAMARKIQKYIKENFGEKISLEEIAALACYSPAYCDTLFKRETGYSINEYCINLRINEAKILLFEKELGLKKIAEKIGYSDYNYFCRLFKKRTGYTPSEYCLWTKTSV